MFTKQSTFTLGLVGLVGLGCLAAKPAQAASFNATAWTPSGDVILRPTISLSTDGKLGDDAPALNGAFNFSKTAASDINTLEPFLGVVPYGLDPANDTAYEGSAIKQTFTAQAGDKLQFNWKFLTNEGHDPNLVVFNDYAFLTVNGLKFNLAGIANATTASSVFATTAANVFAKEGNGSYTYNFATTRDYTIGLGVVDVGDYGVTSALQVSNFQYTAVPTPAMLPGLVGLGLGLLRKRKSDAAA